MRYSSRPNAPMAPRRPVALPRRRSVVRARPGMAARMRFRRRRPPEPPRQPSRPCSRTSWGRRRVGHRPPRIRCGRMPYPQCDTDGDQDSGAQKSIMGRRHRQHRRHRETESAVDGAYLVARCRLLEVNSEGAGQRSGCREGVHTHREEEHADDNIYRNCQGRPPVRATRPACSTRAHTHFRKRAVIPRCGARNAGLRSPNPIASREH